MIHVLAHTQQLMRLDDSFAQYAKLRRKALPELLGEETKKYAWLLYDAFRAIRPQPPVKIAQEAQARDYAMGRRSNLYTGATKGISTAAWTKARDLVGDQQSDLFKVEGTGMSPYRVRFSARRGNRVLLGGRGRRRFAKSAKSAADLVASAKWGTKQKTRDLIAQRVAEWPGRIRRLNLRAAATMVEIMYRTRAARGGFLAQQWLPRVYRNRRSAIAKGGPLIANTRDGRMAGKIEFQVLQDRTIAKLNGYLPGTAKQIVAHGIIGKVEAARRADRNVYIRRKLDEAAKRAFNWRAK